jgi:monothiol glutaredoxin
MELKRHARHAGPAVQFVNGFHPHMVAEVEKAIAQYPIVVVGMRQNPVVRKVRKDLKAAGYEFHYLGYGSYLSRWKERLAIKLWSGWPLFPQVFVKGQLIGGRQETVAALQDGTFKRLLAPV